MIHCIWPTNASLNPLRTIQHISKKAVCSVCFRPELFQSKKAVCSVCFRPALFQSPPRERKTSSFHFNFLIPNCQLLFVYAIYLTFTKAAMSLLTVKGIESPSEVS